MLIVLWGGPHLLPKRYTEKSPDGSGRERGRVDIVKYAQNLLRNKYLFSREKDFARAGGRKLFSTPFHNSLMSLCINETGKQNNSNINKYKQTNKTHRVNRAGL